LKKTSIVWTIPQVKGETTQTQRGILMHKEVPGVLQQRNLCSCPGTIQFDK